MAGSRTRVSASGKVKRKRIIDYPRYGKSGIRRWIPSWRFFLGTFLTGAALVAGLLIAAYASVEIPEPTDFAQSQTSTVYYSDGETVLGEFAEVDRKIINTRELPDHVKYAVVAAEDRTFYQNNGVDFKGIARAFYLNVRYDTNMGASTITQQYAERYFHEDTIGRSGNRFKDYAAKLEEAILALKLSQNQDKEDILDGYMNTIYFGRGAYGIEVAAEKYFDKPAAELTLSEAAMIAGVIPSPSNWDPAKSPEKSLERWNYVLDGMADLGFITQAERAEQEFPEWVEYNPENRFGGPKGYLLALAKAEVLDKTGMTEDDLNSQGVRIVTTFDRNLQRKLEKAISDMPEGGSERLMVAGVTVDPKTGAVRSLYGGADYLTNQYNAATQGQAQAGSTFKPFTLVGAIEEGIPVDNQYFDETHRALLMTMGSHIQSTTSGCTPMVKSIWLRRLRTR